MKIQSIDAFQIYDSRGNPTIEAVVELESGHFGRGMVPSGASTGQFEAHELRDVGSNRFRGKSVFRAVENIRGEIARALAGFDVSDQRVLDEALIQLDGTANKSRLGANAILGVSMAAAAAHASFKGMPIYSVLGSGTRLPLPEIQILGGGAHANWRTDIQDWLVIATGARDYSETLEITFNVFHAAGDIMKTRGKYFGAADEGGLWPEFDSNTHAFDTFAEAVEKAGYTLGKEASLSLDIAASDLYDPQSGLYSLRLDGKKYDSDEFVDQLIRWCRDYSVVSIEDPLADTDWDGWAKFYSARGKEMQVIGDDLFTTNIDRIREGIRRDVANSVLIKLNQIGTVTETIDAIRLTQSAGWAPVVSARSGETEDAFIAHLAVATDAGQLKVGSFSRSERMAKWNEVLRIERDSYRSVHFAGSGALAPLGRKGFK